jgi:GH15 family glucan-1,4-alpha-glucosidase
MIRTYSTLSGIEGSDHPGPGLRLEELGIIGNGQCAALVDRRAAIVWCCLPRFDAEPVFGALLDADGGEFAIEPAAAEDARGTQSYVENTNVLETRFEGADGAWRVVDFAPRFTQHQRAFHPAQIVRVVEPLAGTPAIRVRCSPRLGWSKRVPRTAIGSNHIEYEGYNGSLRLTTDLPLSALDGSAHLLTGPRHFVLSWDAPVEEALAPLARRFLDETRSYWQNWIRECNLPPMYQREVIRSALTLKLHCYEDSGAIAAALTTSLPEELGTGRNWDYRFCWLRDAYYALRALERLGHFEEREKFLGFILNIVAAEPGLDLAPLYRIDGSRVEHEETLDHWSGYRGERPVRVGNAAAKQLQHDIYGELLLALAPMFIDDRFAPGRSMQSLELLERLASKAIAVAGKPDAGIWEIRGECQPHTFSSLMCWVAADRMAHLARRHRPRDEQPFRDAAAHLREEILTRGWNPALGSLVSTYGGDTVDAALLQAVTLRLFEPGDPRAASTIRATREALARNGLLQRYKVDDGFGVPKSAFLICTFWLVEALARIGEVKEARATLDKALSALSPLGLLSEDYDVDAHELRGNFPQAYSHVGLIHAAFAASPSWDDVL